MKKTIFTLMTAAAALLMASCSNADQEFDDYNYQTVYFANQNVVRTITLGDDVYPTDLDNQHKFQVYATLGGVWKNREARTVQVALDPSLCNNLSFASNGNAVTALPSDYYKLESNTITIEEGQIMGCITVDLTDKFFADAKSNDLNYVLPLRIVNAGDSVLKGKDYVLYALKLKNKYTGSWLSRGTDVIDLNGTVSTVIRHAEYVEKDEIRYLTTAGLNVCNYALSNTVAVDVQDASGAVKKDNKTLSCNLLLTFDASDNCTVTTNTADCVVSGNGKWEYQAAKKAWGDKDRDQLVLNYKVRYNYTDNGTQKYKTYECKDTLVMQSRLSKKELFTTK